MASQQDCVRRMGQENARQGYCNWTDIGMGIF